MSKKKKKKSFVVRLAESINMVW